MKIEALEVQIEGSTGNPYLASFTREGNTLKTSCTCPAGEKRTHCKHRLSLLEGDLSRVRGAYPEALPQLLSAMLEGTEVQSALRALAHARDESSVADAKLKLAKRALDRAMHKWALR
jgi:uncharacterized Zn finger protein